MMDTSLDPFDKDKEYVGIVAGGCPVGCPFLCNRVKKSARVTQDYTRFLNKLIQKSWICRNGRSFSKQFGQV